MAVWNVGTFMLRRAPDEIAATFWEIVIHAGVVLLPAFYYHFVLIFLESTTQHRPSLVVVYLLAAFFSVVNLSGSPLFTQGVKWTYWGWTPAIGPLYYLFFPYFFGFLIYGLSHLVKAYRGVDSSFRRNRATLILLGTLVSVAGGFIDIARFLLARAGPAPGGLDRTPHVQPPSRVLRDSARSQQTHEHDPRLRPTHGDPRARPGAGRPADPLRAHDLRRGAERVRHLS